ncbi:MULTISPECIES: hypothetical protein [unclassified Marivivens]|jgi:hypothetical protein|uniref:hypothetical protein n=1 Tax=unclassified Marivivens TaxID=2622455 RepID=UPI0008023D11|nr:MULTISPECIES: hypothetical protein [unclassified Marivivens]APO86222.1 hypothetical protein BSK21_03695 [Marivivens sp. JLT3646]NVJ95401.1 hypothetical protein [Marivivens sp.]OBR37981.1 hypothetical protein A9199_05170 [Donghicola sp. JL3646]
MTPDDIIPLFTRADGSFLCARWGRPIVPVIFGVEEETLSVLKGAIEVVVAMSGHKMAETDPELGANLMIFFCREWADISGVPNLEKLVDGLDGIVERLEASNANQFRTFKFDSTGAISACVVFIRMDAQMAKLPAEDIALAQAAQMLLTWGDGAFASKSPLALANGVTVLRPDIASVIAAAYHPVLPACDRDPSHAYRLAARTELS